VIVAVKDRVDDKLIAVGREDRGKVVSQYVVAVSDKGICALDSEIGKLEKPFWLLKITSH